MSILDFLFGKTKKQRKGNNNAHLFLLSGFRTCQDPTNFVTSSHWESLWQKALQEPPQRAIEYFITEGKLVPATLAVKLAYAFKSTEIKTLLRERGLAVSGRKDQGIERLVVADPQGMKEKVANLNLYECSPVTRDIVDKFLKDQEYKRQSAENRCLDQLRAGDFSGTISTISSFEADQVFPRSIDSSNGVEIIRAIMEGRPKILNGLLETEWKSLNMAAAMMAVWGTNKASQWLPKDFVGLEKFDHDTSARMSLFHGRHQKDMANYLSDLDLNIKKVEILGGGEDSCPECKKIANKIYTIKKAPELPYEKCTHKMGCGCAISPILD